MMERALDIRASLAQRRDARRPASAAATSRRRSWPSGCWSGRGCSSSTSLPARRHGDPRGHLPHRRRAWRARPTPVRLISAGLDGGHRRDRPGAVMHEGGSPASWTRPAPMEMTRSRGRSIGVEQQHDIPDRTATRRGRPPAHPAAALGPWSAAATSPSSGVGFARRPWRCWCCWRPSPPRYVPTEQNFTNPLRQMVTVGLLAYGMLVVILDRRHRPPRLGSVVAALRHQSAPGWSRPPDPTGAHHRRSCRGYRVRAGQRTGDLPAWSRAVRRHAGRAHHHPRGLASGTPRCRIAPRTPASSPSVRRWPGRSPVPTLIMVGVFLIGGVFLTRTPAGRAIVAIGAPTARPCDWAGISVKKHLVLATPSAAPAPASRASSSPAGSASRNPASGSRSSSTPSRPASSAARAWPADGGPCGPAGGVLVLSLINNLLNLARRHRASGSRSSQGLIIIAVIIVQRRSMGERA